MWTVVRLFRAAFNVEILLVVGARIADGWHILFPNDGARLREGGRTIYRTPLGLKATVVLIAALAAWRAFSQHPGDSAGRVLLGAVAMAALLALPGPVVVDAAGIRRRTFWLIPFLETRLKWREIDSAFQLLESADYERRLFTITVSAGPNRAMNFTWAHGDRELFLADLEERAVPLLRIGD